jgi:hypothetical protein
MKGYVGLAIGFGVGFYTKGLINYMSTYDQRVEKLKDDCKQTYIWYNELVGQENKLNEECQKLGLETEEEFHKIYLPVDFEIFKLSELKEYRSQLTKDTADVKVAISHLTMRLESYYNNKGVI